MFEIGKFSLIYMSCYFAFFDSPYGFVLYFSSTTALQLGHFMIYRFFNVINSDFNYAKLDIFFIEC